MKTPHAHAAEIGEIISSVPPFLVLQMARAYSIVNTPGQEQAILDAMPDFGVTPAETLALYVTMRSALSSIGLGGTLPEANLSVFVQQEDGSVLYVAPIVLEEEPEAE